MPAGRILLLVGPSCVGKSTLTRAIQDAADEPWLALSLDGLFAAVPDRWGGGGAERAAGFHYVIEGEVRRIAYGEVGWRLLQGFHRAAAAYALAGNNVVIDDMLLDAASLADWTQALAGLDTRLVRLTAPLQALTRREAARERRRTPGLAAGHYALHEGVDADLVIDTSRLAPAAAAGQVLALRRPGP
jgi:chloramphenicol 3-O phosphotransferase